MLILRGFRHKARIGLLARVKNMDPILLQNKHSGAAVLRKIKSAVLLNVTH